MSILTNVDTSLSKMDLDLVKYKFFNRALNIYKIERSKSSSINLKFGFDSAMLNLMSMFAGTYDFFSEKFGLSDYDIDCLCNHNLCHVRYLNARIGNGKCKYLKFTLDFEQEVRNFITENYGSNNNK